MVPNVEVDCNPLSYSARQKQVATLGVHVSCMYTMHMISTIQTTQHSAHILVLTLAATVQILVVGHDLRRTGSELCPC